MVKSVVVVVATVVVVVATGMTVVSAQKMAKQQLQQQLHPLALSLVLQWVWQEHPQRCQFKTL
jgi:hypothetical protein